MSDAANKDRERLDAFEKELEADPRSLVFIALAEELVGQEKFEEAATVAQKGLVYHPDSVAGRLALAQAEAGRNNIRQALEQAKRALLIDRDNPRALALMGRILLQKGLAKRAMQFLGHAVKLAPTEIEYRELLGRAKKAAQSESPLPAFRADPQAMSPWSPEALGEDSHSEDEVRSPDAEHTVFDPDALKVLKARDDAKRNSGLNLDRALAELDESGATDSEPTRFDGRARKSAVAPASELPPPRRVDRMEETHDNRGPLAKKKPMVGGSAAEFSQMMRQVRDGARNGEAAQPPAQIVDEGDDEDATVAADSAPGAEAKKPEPKPKKEPPAKEPAPKEAPMDSSRSRPVDKSVQPASTRMVDEALWALLGGKVDPSSAPKPAQDSADKKGPDKEKASAESKDREHKKGAAPKPEAQGMVVRTSERFGTVFRAAVMLVLIVGAAWAGYGFAVSSGGGAAIPSEEMKGIASDLERGGLARLLAAEEKALALLPTLPQMSDLLTSALAEIYARRWASFGRDPDMLAKAKEKIEALRGTTDPSVELLAAMVTLSTSTLDRSAIDRHLERAAKTFPESPKIWVLRSRLASLDARTEEAEDDLYTARAINPQHRTTLLDLARWHARQGAYPPAFIYFDQLQSLYPEDVEAAIERYMLGQITGRDPGEVQATSVLAGLVRQELADVAKDEAGRVALAFAVPKLARGELEAGVEELGKADGAFEHSAEFKSAIAGVYLSIGQWRRAKQHYERALQIDPESAAHRLGIARASYGERSGLRVTAEQLKRTATGGAKVGTVEAKAAEKRMWSSGVAVLPFATVRLVMGRFSLVVVEPNREVFPETAYAAAKKSASGIELRDALEAVDLVALAGERIKAGAVEEAMSLLDDAQKLKDDASLRVAYARAYQAKKDLPSAIRYYRRAIDADSDNVAARIGLATAFEEKRDLTAAIAALEPLEKGEVVVPQAMMVLARLRAQHGDAEGTAGSLDVELRSHDPGGAITLGEGEHRAKKKDDALETFRRALKEQPKLVEKALEKTGTLSAIALLYIGRIEADRDETRGIQILKRCVKREDAPDEAHFYLGKALIKRPKGKNRGKKELEQYRGLVTSGELFEEAGRLLR
jgi:tetratricopeptide (TPR) repeat protein